eukprot:6475451-Amphidinium_carterae.1
MFATPSVLTDVMLPLKVRLRRPGPVFGWGRVRTLVGRAQEISSLGHTVWMASALHPLCLVSDTLLVKGV